MDNASYSEMLAKMFKNWQDQFSERMKDPKAMQQQMELVMRMQQEYFDMMRSSEQTVTPHEPTQPSPSTDRPSATNAYEQLSLHDCQQRIAQLEKRLWKLEQTIAEQSESRSTNHCNG